MADSTFALVGGAGRDWTYSKQLQLDRRRPSMRMLWYVQWLVWETMFAKPIYDDLFWDSEVFVSYRKASIEF